MSGATTFKPLLEIGAPLLMLLWAGDALAQRSDAKILNDASSAGSVDCPIVTIRFTGPIRYSGATPIDQGMEVRLRVDMPQGGVPSRDFLPVPDGARLIRSILYEADAAGGPALLVSFRTLTRFEVTLGHDSQSLVLSLRNIARQGDCPVEQAGESVVAPLETAELRRLQSVAEEAVANGQYAVAADALDRILGQRDTEYAPRALELSGMIHERRDERGPARLRYEDYLRRFSGNTGADRVRQRLGALGRGDGSGSALPPAQGQEWRTSFSGGISQFYSRDVSRNVFINARRPDPIEEVDRRVNIDQLLTAIDINMAATNADIGISARAAGSYTLDWRPVTLVGSSRSFGDDTQRVSALYIDAQLYRLGLSARIGRQSLFGSGVFGRFDGIRAGWKLDPSWTLHAQAGRPVFSTRTDRIVHDRGFYGLTLGYAPPDTPFELSAYWFDQRSAGLVDRQAVGLEARHTTPGLALWGMVDVDIGLGTISYAFLNATASLSGGGSLGVQFDQQYYPSLSLSNAVIGQPVPRLAALKEMFTHATIEQWAKDRSARTRSLSLIYTQPLMPKWQANLDMVLSRTAGMPASGGVEAIAGSGTEYYLGAQMTGSGIIVNGDTLIFGLRHARTARFRILSLDAAARFPLGAISIEPRFRFARRTDRFGPGHQNAYRPSLRVTGAASPNVTLDAEIGFTFLDQKWFDAAFIGQSEERATILNIGYRFTF